jgi:hypothetical protein
MAPGVGSFYRYSGFGLTFDCEIACPDFIPSDGPVDARIRVGAVPERLERPITRGPIFEGEPNRVLLNFPGTARFLVQDGREITVHPAREASEDSVRLFLTGPALGALLLQRGALVLHAAACASTQGAILLAGLSGRGKSTLLAALLTRGHVMLADDVTTVALDATGHPIAHPASAQLKLCADSLGSVGRDPRDCRPVRPGVPKYWVPATAEFCRHPRRILTVYVVDYHSGGDIQFVPLMGQERLSAIRSHLYCPRLAEGLRLHPAHFSVAAALASKVPVVRVSRPRGLAFVDGVVDAIEQRSF